MQQSSRNKAKFSCVQLVILVLSLIAALVFTLSVRMSMAQSAAGTQTAVAEVTSGVQTSVARSNGATQRALDSIATQTQSALDDFSTQTAYAPTEIALQTQIAPINKLIQLCQNVYSSPVESATTQGPIWFVRNGESLALSAVAEGYATSAPNAKTLACIYDELRVVEVCKYFGSVHQITRKAKDTLIHLVNIENEAKVEEISIEGFVAPCPPRITEGPGVLPPPSEIVGDAASNHEIFERLQSYLLP